MRLSVSGFVPIDMGEGNLKGKREEGIKICHYLLPHYIGTQEPRQSLDVTLDAPM